MNRATIVGRLGHDPEIQTGASGKEYARIRIATNDGWGDRKQTNWHSCTVFGGQCVLLKGTQKGSIVGVSGRIEYKDKDGGGRYTNIIVELGGLEVLWRAGDREEPKGNDHAVSFDDLPF